jgi:hypothetical protein
MNIYVQAASKASVNVLLKAGATVMGEVCNMSDPASEGWRSLADCPAGTVVKFWSKRDPFGTPIAKAYGNVKHSGGKVSVT